MKLIFEIENSSQINTPSRSIQTFFSCPFAEVQSKLNVTPNLSSSNQYCRINAFYIMNKRARKRVGNDQSPHCHGSSRQWAHNAATFFSFFFSWTPCLWLLILPFSRRIIPPTSLLNIGLGFMCNRPSKYFCANVGLPRNRRLSFVFVSRSQFAGQESTKKRTELGRHSATTTEMTLWCIFSS